MSAVILMVMDWHNQQSQGNQKIETLLAVQKLFKYFITYWCYSHACVKYRGSNTLKCLNHYWFCSKTSLYHDWMFSYEFRNAIRLRAVLCCSSWRWKEIIIIYLPLIWQENCYDERMKSQQSSNIITSFPAVRKYFLMKITFAWDCCI